MRKTIINKFDEYKKKHNGNPKYCFSDFIRIINKIEHHRTYIRPKIKWWSEVHNTELNL